MRGADHPIVGILGGMGPEATVDLMRRVIAATPAMDDRDHIHMIVDNNPKVPSRIAALIEGTGESPAPALMQMAQGLEKVGAQILVMPCNSAHAYLENIRSAVTIPVFDMVGLTAQRVTKLGHNPQRVGILASTAVNKTKLYETALAAHAVALVVPQQQSLLMDVIMAVKRAEITSDTRNTFQAIAGDLSSHGVDALVLACTELSILASDLDTELPTIDALDVLTEAIVDFGLESS